MTKEELQLIVDDNIYTWIYALHAVAFSALPALDEVQQILSQRIAENDLTTTVNTDLIAPLSEGYSFPLQRQLESLLASANVVIFRHDDGSVVNWAEFFSVLRTTRETLLRKNNEIKGSFILTTEESKKVYVRGEELGRIAVFDTTSREQLLRLAKRNT